MATGAQLILSVRDKVQDPNLADAEILAHLNACIDKIATEPGLTIPHLDTIGTVTTVVGEDEAALPANCPAIYAAKDGDNDLDVYDSWPEMSRTLANASGSLSGVAVYDGVLKYLPEQATATAITIYYFRAPTAITEETEPDIFSRFTRKWGETTLVYYAAYKLWDQIEDGLEGQKVNTITHRANYDEAKGNFKRQIREGGGRPRPARNVLW